MSSRAQRTLSVLAADALGRSVSGRPMLLVAHPSSALADWASDVAASGDLTVISTPQGADYYRPAARGADVRALDRRGGPWGLAAGLTRFRRETAARDYGIALAGWAEGRPPTLAVCAAVSAAKATVKGVLLEDGHVRTSRPRTFAVLAARQRLAVPGGVLARLRRLWLLALVYARLGWVLATRGRAASIRGGR